MARARAKPRKRAAVAFPQEPSYWLLGVAVCLLIAAILGGYGYLQWGVPHPPKLKQGTLCPTDGPRSVTVVLLDATDALPDITKREVRSRLTDIAETLPPYGLLEMRLLDPAVPGGRVTFLKCNPGDGSNLSELVANPAMAHKLWVDDFHEPLERALEGTLAPAPADTSPIMETIQRIAIDRFTGRSLNGTPKSLVIVSDMMENGPGYTQYHGDLSYERFRATPAYKQLKTDLQGARVSIQYAQRLAPGLDSKKHLEFWLQWIRDNDGVPAEAVKLQGAG